jgi:ABC-2 type transport system permease protein
MKKYLTFFNLYFKDVAAYKADVLLSMATTMVYIFVFYIVWKAVYTGGNLTQISGYTLPSVVTYYLVTNVFARADVADQILLSDSIWFGELAKDLTRPWNIKLTQFLMFVGNILYNLLMHLPFLIILLLIFHNFVILPSFIYLLYFFVTLILSILLGMSFFSIFHSLTFFYGDQSSNINLFGYLIMGMSGGIFPLDFLPSNVSWIFLHLPFRFLVNTPAKVFLEKMTAGEIFSSWLEMSIWIIFFYLIFHFLFKKGLREFSGVGL